MGELNYKKNGQALVSVIVPIYNAEPFLKKALASLENQTYRNMEILLVDDGSTDGSKEICADFIERDPRFRYFYQANRGVSAARNTALHHVSGAYIAFMDSDDWVEPDYIETMVRLLEETGSDLAMILPFGRNTRAEPNEQMLLLQEPALKEMFAGVYFDGVIGGKLFKREIVAEGAFPESVALFEDMIFAAKAICHANQVAFQAVPKYHYTFNPNSATKAKWNPKVWTCIDAAEMLYQIMKDHAPEHLAYGGKAACYANLVIAQKLAGCGALTRENYLRVKHEVLKYYHADVKAVLGHRYRAELFVLLHSRWLYTICRRVSKSKVVMRVRRVTGH